jgi:Carbamoyl-phosphate synthase L chain, ATP binding domain
MSPVNNMMITSGTTADGPAPKVLLITAYRWPTTTRLALALSDAGFAVDALCSVGHSLAQVQFISKVYRYRALSPLRSLRDAIVASEPDLVIPCDDTTAAQLHQLHKLTDATDPVGNGLRSLIAHSLGDPANYPIFYSRAQIASLAHAAGVLSPTATNIHNHDELFRQLKDIGFPAVLKSDGSFGGRGVAFVHSRAEAKRAFAKLTGYNNVARALARLLIDRDANLVLPCLRRTRPQVSIQRFLSGKRANAAVACWKGVVLAQVCVEVIDSNDAAGAATVVSVIAHPGMSQAVERLVRALNLSGLCGFDFILDSVDGSAYLIDFNPRATQTCHLVSSERTRPVLALAAKLRGLPEVVDDQLNPHCGPIVLFPHGLAYPPQGQCLKYAEIDQASKSPELIKIGLEFHERKNRLLNKAFRLARKK